MGIDDIAKQLPRCYLEDAEMREICVALTALASEKLQEYSGILDNFAANYLEPETAKATWLDYLAQQSAWGSLWDASWTEQQKRELLKNTDFLWKNRGNREAIAFLFKTFNLNASLQPSTGFILRQTQFPGRLGSDPFDYQVKVPSNYQPGTPEYRLIVRLLRNFSPCWCSFVIVAS